MKLYKQLLIVCCLVPGMGTYSQDLQKIAAGIEEEGKMLYQSEKASWHGTDIFLERFKARERIGGYLSYLEPESAVCIFFSNEKPGRVIGTIRFDYSFSPGQAALDLTEREFSSSEKDLYIFRQKALQLLQEDTAFQMYENSNVNLIPVIHGGEKKVYILTGPSKGGVIIFGNDYLFTFDKNNNHTGTKKLHKNIMWTEINDTDENGNKIVGSAHIHLEGSSDFMTATDLCTLLLYAGYTKWESYSVVSEKYISLLNIKSMKLTILPREED